MSRKLILAHDLGTSGDKACLFDEAGNFLAEAYYKYDTYYPAEGYAEHDPRSWWDAVKASTKEVVQNAKADPSEVKAISFSAHGMGAIPVDKEGNLLVDRVMQRCLANCLPSASWMESSAAMRKILSLAEWLWKSSCLKTTGAIILMQAS